MRLRTVVLLALLLTTSATAHALPTTTRRGVVAAAHPLAAQAGASILAGGGNATDALVATAFALGVVEPHSSGLGGGGFALVYEAKTGRVSALDFRETAPALATPALFERDGVYDPSLSRFGGRAVGVPGAPAGYVALAERFGRLPLSQTVRPAVRLAVEGIPIGAGHKRIAAMVPAMLERYPGLDARYGYWRGALGDVVRQPELGKLIAHIGQNGRSAFYEGEVAQALVDAVRADGGAMTLEDLRAYRVRDVEPLVGRFRGHAVVTFPAPSAGGMTVLHALGVLDRFPAPRAQSSNAPLYLHRTIEAWRQSFAARARFAGDPRVTPSITERQTALLSASSLDRLARSIGRYPTPPPDLLPLFREGDDTSHLCVVDEAGNVALMTTTINGPFGSGLVVPSVGLVLNNENDDFSPPVGGNLYGLEGGRYNAIAGGKTPVSSMSPTLVFDGDRPWIAVGAAGGSTIPTTVAQIIVSIVDGGLNVQEALARGRIHAQLSPDIVSAEPHALDDATIEALRAMRHDVRVRDSAWGNAQAIVIGRDGIREAAADPRGAGAAVSQ